MLRNNSALLFLLHYPDVIGFPHVVLHMWRKVTAYSVCVHGHQHVHTVRGGGSGIRYQYPHPSILSCREVKEVIEALEQTGKKASRCSESLWGNRGVCNTQFNRLQVNIVFYIT